MRVVEQILAFGEDAHDCEAVRTLVQGLRPDLNGRVAVETRRAPLTLIKGMDEARRQSRAGKVIAAVRADHVKRPVRACVFHEDTDHVEPSHQQLAAAIHRTYQRCRGSTVAAVAAWKVEAWWYLFPDAVASVRRTWHAPAAYRGRDFGLIVSPKERLKRDVRPPGLSARASFRTYQEDDSPTIARAVVDGGWLHRPAGRSASWEAFVHQVMAI